MPMPNYKNRSSMVPELWELTVRGGRARFWNCWAHISLIAGENCWLCRRKAEIIWSRTQRHQPSQYLNHKQTNHSSNLLNLNLHLFSTHFPETHKYRLIVSAGAKYGRFTQAALLPYEWLTSAVSHQLNSQ